MRPPAAVALLVLLPALAAADAEPVAVKIDKLTAPAPAGWAAEKPANRLRSYQFKIAGPKDTPDAELVVLPESDPKPEKVFPRWKAAFVPPEGKTVDDVAKVGRVEGAKGVRIDVLDFTGTWKFKERPFDPKSKEEVRDDYRVVWVVVADADEATHVRLSGPRETVDKAYPGFEAWLKALK